jgi:hypothetical protein
MIRTIKKGMNKALQLTIIFVIVVTVLGMSKTVRQLVALATDDKPVVGQHALEIEPGSEKVNAGGKLWARWHVERLRNDCIANYRTTMTDSTGREYTLDEKFNTPLSQPAAPGVVHSYARSYTVPADSSTGTAYMTSRLSARCNPLQQALNISRTVNYNFAYFVVTQKENL